MTVVYVFRMWTYTQYVCMHCNCSVHIHYVQVRKCYDWAVE